LAPPEGKIINADDMQFIILFTDPPTDHSQQGVLAYRHHEALGKSGPRPATERQPKVVDYCFKPLSAPSIASQHAVIELFTKNASPANDSVAPKATRQDLQNDAAATKGKIRRSTHISALNPSTWSPTVRANPKSTA
jgi:hypothetical protein